MIGQDCNQCNQRNHIINWNRHAHEEASSFFCMVYGACLSVTLPSITSGWLDAIDQKKLGELHEIFMMMTPLKIDYADYVDYVITLITPMSTVRDGSPLRSFLFLRLTHHIPQKGSVSDGSWRFYDVVGK